MKLSQLFQLNCHFRSLRCLAGDLSTAHEFHHFALLHHSMQTFSPGDLLISTGICLPRDEAYLLSLFADTPIRTATGLIVSAAEDYDPSPLHPFSRQYSIPILAFPLYSDINETFNALKAALQGAGCYASFICSSFRKKSEALLATHPHFSDILSLLYEFLNVPIFLFSDHYTLSLPIYENEYLQTARMIWNTYQTKEMPSLYIPHGAQHYYFFPVYDSRETIAELCAVYPQSSPPTDADRMLIETALPQLSFLILQNYLEKPLLYKKTSSFMEAILSGVFEDDPELLMQNARFLAIAYTQKRILCIIESTPANVFENKVYVNRINEYFSSMRRRYISFQQCNGRLFYMVECDDPQKALSELEQIVLPQLDRLISNTGGFTLTASISSHFDSLNELPRAFSEADFALQIGRKMAPKKSLYLYDDYLLYHLLDSIKDTHAISLIYSEVISVLSDYDRQNNTELLSTLLSLCQNNFNALQAADKMYLHRNSLYKRIDRISSILDMDLDLPDNLIVLHLAAKLHELLN